MSDLHQLGPLISIQKGKPPKSFEANSAAAQPYLSPEYLRGIAPPTLAEPFQNSLTATFGDVVLLWDGSNAGEAFRARPGIVASTMAVIRPDQSFDLGYFFHALKWAEPHLKSQTNGTGIPHVDRHVLEEVAVYRPAKPDQSKIAEVLDTLDAAIRGTEAVVAKLRAMKQGLLHDLLTRGIDANCDLRPPYPEAPHLYHQTPLGWLPKEWEAREVQDLLAPVDPAMRSGPFGSALLKEELVSEGVPFLGIDNVHVERFDRDYKRFVTPGKFQQLRRYAVRPNDLMITIMGTVGRCCLVPDDIGDALSSKHTWTISLDQAKYSPYLAMLQVNYCDWVLRHFSKDQQGGTMSAIRSETIRSTLLPVPSPAEQANIEAILLELANRLTDETAMLDKLRLQKSGLMDDLLTGRVPVTPLL
jgi:type I restriction enzyme S subunit